MVQCCESVIHYVEGCSVQGCGVHRMKVLGVGWDVDGVQEDADAG